MNKRNVIATSSERKSERLCKSIHGGSHPLIHSLPRKRDAAAILKDATSGHKQKQLV